LKALIVSWGKPYPEQQALWERVASKGIDLTYVHSEPVLGEAKGPNPARTTRGIEYVTLPVIRARSGPTWWWYRGLRAVVGRIRPDVLHVLSEPWALFVLQSLLVRGRRRDMAVFAHGCDNVFTHGTGVERRARAAMLHLTLSGLDGYLSWNRAGGDLARRFGLPEKRPVMVIPGIIPDPELFDRASKSRPEARSRFWLPTEAVVIGFLGRLSEEKGVHDLLRVIERLDLPSVYWAVWGDGPLSTEVEECFAGNPDRGAWLGSIPLDRVPEALLACDIVVIPSRSSSNAMEQLSRVAVEAMLAGIPIVAYSSGALPEVVGGAGVLVPEADVDGLVGALTTLINDPARRASLRALGRDRWRCRFAPEVLADGVLDFWTGALAARAR
jgi:glycosyltransferase involved in cell wall biosynthesis